VRVGVQTTGVGKASSELDHLRDKFDKLQKQGAKGFAIGAGAAITAKGLSLLDSAASGLINVLGDATQAAIEEEQSIAKLDAALRANVAGWDGNTEAIEKVLASRMKLGFSDDEQRQSLSLLVAATNDVTKAMDLQRTAMDLARLKGISLQQASEALIKVEAGQFRLLKSLGIELKEGATQAEALAAAQKAAAGQAEAFANTNAGKLLKSQIQVDEAMEHLGAVTMPLVADGAETLAGAIETLIPFFDLLNGKLPETEEEFRGWIDLINGINLNPLTMAHERAFDMIDQAAAGSTKSIRHYERAVEESTDAAYDARDAAEDLEEALDDLTDAAYDSVDAFGDQSFSATELKGRIAELTMELGEAKAELLALEAIKNPTAAQQLDIDAARGKVAGYEHDLFDTRVELAKLNGTGLDALLKQLSAAQYRTDALGDEAREALSLFQKLSYAAGKATGYNVDPGFAPRKYAKGGWAGMNGPELAVLGDGGEPELVIPKSDLQSAPSGGGGGWSGGSGMTVMVPVTVIGQLTPAQTLALGQQLTGAIFTEAQNRGLYAR